MEQQRGIVSSELLERLKVLQAAKPSLAPDHSTPADLAYHRAREVLERAIEEARTIRLQAIADARATREVELTSLLEAMKSLREAADKQIEARLREAEVEARRIHAEAVARSRVLMDSATQQAAVKREADENLMRARNAEVHIDDPSLAVTSKVEDKRTGKGLWGRIRRK